MDISSTASALFGSASAKSIVSATQATSGTSDQQSARSIINAHNREINRIRGYKLDLTPSDKRKLVELKEKIQAIETKASKGTVREDELDDRLEMLDEADVIIGKPIVDVEADQQLANFNSLKLALLEPKLDNAIAKRVAFFERFRDTIEQQINDNPDRFSLQLKFQSVVKQLDVLKPLRSTSQLSVAERKAYDDIVELINDHAGVKIELTSQESDKVDTLKRSIEQFENSLGPDISKQPTPQAVARAYTALTR
ncbi:MAG: hypothetical protein ACE5FM_01265 [Methyloligellaceae bacterium]